MKIHFLKNGEIDKQAWDNCIANAPAGLPYALSWYLDVVTNGQWDALVADNYSIVMPLPWNKKLIFKQVYQPFFAQQLGVFSKGAIKANIIHQFLESIPKYFIKIHLHLNAENTVPDLRGWNSRQRQNLVLPLQKPAEAIFQNFSKSLRKNIRRARRRGLQSGRADTAAALTGLYQKEIGDRIPELKPENYKTINRLMEEAIQRNKGFIKTIYNQNGARLASGFFLSSHRRIINLFGASTATGKDNYAMHFMLYEVIRLYCDSALLFDFEGASIDSIAAFFKSFGAMEKPYTVLSKSLF